LNKEKGMILIMNEIIEYIKQKYKPISVIIYGSYSDGTNNENSDFDALIITNDHSIFHDISTINRVKLDIFIYPISYFTNDFDCDEFVQIFDGKIILDTNNFGVSLKNKIITYINNYTYKSNTQLKNEIEWCKKMLLRAQKDDVEGRFRWHWLLIDSLEIFADIMQHYYFGPKKTLKWMKLNYPKAYEYYKNALFDFKKENLKKWINFIEELI